MATLDAVYLPDLGRVRITLEDPTSGVRYRLQRSTDAQPAWTDVRGGRAMGDDGVTVVDDYEYTPNVVNRYRVLAASFVDTFDRVYPMGGALQLTGEPGNASTPNNANVDITGDITIRFDGTLDSWFGEQRGLVAKWAFTGDQRSFLLTIEDDGRLRFWFTNDGITNVDTPVSTVPVPVGSGRLAVKVTRDESTGDVNFYTAPFDSGSISDFWTQLGDTVPTTPGPMFSGTAPLEIGAWNEGDNGQLDGLVHRVILIASTGTAAHEANPNFSQQTPGDTSFVDGVGNTWTINGDAEIIAFAPLKGFNWGTADTGQEWFLGGSSSGFAVYVDNGVGVIETILPNGFITEMTVFDEIPGAENAEITWSASYPGDTLDSLIEFNVGLRASDDDNFYEGQLFFEDDTGGTLGGPRDVFIRIGKFVGDVYTAISSTVEVGGEWVPNIPWHVRFRVNGSLIQMRAWQEGSPEPTNWQVSASDTDLTSGTGVHVRAQKGGEEPAELHFGPMELFTIPPNVGATDTVTPVEARTMLKSVTYPSLNQPIDCEDWDALTRNSRAGFFNIKGRHEILAITDVGSSATFNLTFVTQSEDENRAIKALLTYGGVLLLQPPGDIDDDCHFGTYSGTPSGYVVPSGSVQAHSVHGQPIWLWTVAFTKVAATDVAGIIPTTITWQQLWDIIGPEGTWETVWATWPTWQDLWLTSGSISSFGS